MPRRRLPAFLSPCFFRSGAHGHAELPTDERLRKFSAGEDDPLLIALLYQFGRYLLISSSRPGNLVPANGQGIWGDGLSLPWGCDYKSNINFQMNYWPVETANLSECHTPMLRFIETVVEPGRKTAKAYFDAPGWMMAYTTNAWGWTAPGPSGPWGPFFLGGAWLCQHLWEHYSFTRNRTYLKSVYPVCVMLWRGPLVMARFGPLGQFLVCLIHIQSWYGRSGGSEAWDAREGGAFRRNGRRNRPYQRARQLSFLFPSFHGPLETE